MRLDDGSMGACQQSTLIQPYRSAPRGTASAGRLRGSTIKPPSTEALDLHHAAADHKKGESPTELRCGGP